MTIPSDARRNWCPSCDETCDDHSRICTVCGTHLEYPRENRSSSTNDATTISVLPLELAEETRRAGRELRELLRHIQAQINDTGREQRELLLDIQQAAQEWQTIPAAWLNPSSSVPDRPTSMDYLQQMPRIHMSDKSTSIFSTASLTVGSRRMEAIPADFGPAVTDKVCLSGSLIRVGTGKDGLSSEAKRQARQNILFFTRGDLTFAEKANLAQELGATAVVIGNHVSEPWPYVMKDSKRQAHDLKIPVVMIKLADANWISSSQQQHQQEGAVVECILDIVTNSKECVVCQETYEMGHTVLRLPCGHCFHEACALAWLTRHNTCPYCRSELPTDDADYEAERRRRMTSSGSQVEYYG